MPEMQLKEKLQRILTLEEYAAQLGYSRTCLILAREIKVDERVRMKCQINTCSHYQRNFMCPPFLPSLEEIRKILANYTFALLLQLRRSLGNAGSWQEEFDQAGRWLTETLIKLEKKAFELGFPFALGLGGGECKLCSPCAAAEGEKLCRQPGAARPSMEAMGIDVLAVSQKAGLPVEFTPSQLTAVGLLLID